MAAIRHECDGLVVVENGHIADIGPTALVAPRWPGLVTEHWSGHLIVPGFVDAHAHYPQTAVIASYGTRLLEWLEKYTFPEEAKFADPAYARRAADLYLDLCLAHGITSASIYSTVHAGSVDALFEAASARDMAICSGKVMMDRNAPVGLRDTARQGYDDSRAGIARWHGRGRCRYVVTPRFAPTSTPEQLEAAGALWRENPTCGMQTHLSENPSEVAWVRELFPEARDYLDVYDRFGLVGPGANFGHAIHLTADEITRLRQSGAGISHCPTSNTFIGSGLFDLAGLRGAATPIPVGLATDVGGGSSFSPFATMRAAYEIGQLRGQSLHPAKLWYLATVGAAQVIGRSSEVGNLTVGHAADIVVLDLHSTPLLRHRMSHARDLADELFALIVLADDRAIAATHVLGKVVYRAPRTGRQRERHPARPDLPGV
jgi:guanine deaminase